MTFLNLRRAHIFCCHCPAHWTLFTRTVFIFSSPVRVRQEHWVNVCSLFFLFPLDSTKRNKWARLYSDVVFWNCWHCVVFFLQFYSVVQRKYLFVFCCKDLFWCWPLEVIFINFTSNYLLWLTYCDIFPYKSFFLLGDGQLCTPPSPPPLGERN